jgi:usherin
VATSTVLSDLQPNFNYSVVVEACTAAGCTASAPAFALTLKQAPAVPNPPLAQVLDARRIAVAWSAPTSPNQPILRYELFRSGRLIHSTTTLSFLDSEITPVTLFYYVLEAFNDFGSSRSGATVVRTLSDAPSNIPAPVVSAASSTALRLTWAQPGIPNGQILSYDIFQANRLDPVCSVSSVVFTCLVSVRFGTLRDFVEGGRGGKGREGGKGGRRIRGCAAP